MVAFDFPASLDIDKLINEIKISPTYNKELNITEFDIAFPGWLYKNYSIEEVKNIVNFITKIIINEIKEKGGGDPIRPPEMTIESRDNVPQKNTGGEPLPEAMLLSPVTAEPVPEH